MIKSVVVGNAADIQVSATRGWAVGHMHEGTAQAKEVEIKMWSYQPPFEYGKKAFGGTEYIVVTMGEIRLELEQGGETQTVILKGSTQDYVVLPPGTIKQIFVEESAAGITVRWPSAPDLNQVIE